MRIAIGLLLIAGMFSCNDSALEQRVTNLEKKIAALESGGTTESVSNRPVGNVVESSSEGMPLFRFETTEFDFGTIKEGTVVNHTFEFTNIGEAPLIIQDATATCGCTVPSFSRQPIPVGGKGRIEVSFDSRSKIGQQSPVVTVTANTNPPVTRLLVKGFVQSANPIQ
jgi:hypothetical protein